MTTPAIHTDENQAGNGTKVIYWADGSGNEVSDYPVSSWRHRIEQRPASVSNPKQASGWRDPSGWQHSFFYATPNPMIAFGNGRQDVTGTVDYFDGAGWSDSVGETPDPSPTARNRAEIKALLQLKNQRVNYAQAFVEADQTAKLFVGAMSRIASEVRDFRSKNPKAIWEAVKGEGKRGKNGLPSSWLELQYGWTPLLSDVQGACDDLSHASDQKFTACVRGQVKEGGHTMWKKRTAINGTCGINVSQQWKVDTKVRLDYVMENPILATLAQTGITNPLLLVWEKLPYSFVVDWCLPVGNWLSAWDATFGWSFKGGTCTVYRKFDETGHSWFNEPSGMLPL